MVLISTGSHLLKKMMLRKKYEFFQEILCGLSYAVCVDSGEEKQSLENRIKVALTQPEKIHRFGGLSLGESRDLIDDIRILEHLPSQQECKWLLKNPNGEALPVWVDYQGSENTHWETFILGDFNQQAFCSIQPDDAGTRGRGDTERDVSQAPYPG